MSASKVNRRRFLNQITGTVAALPLLQRAEAALQEIKIKRIRFYRSPLSRPMVNQSFHLVTVETDQGITGVGEGGNVDGMRHCAELLIGQDARRIEHLWQYMYRAYFYPPGRDNIHALGALDLALWDIKGKALDVPVYELLGGLVREHIPCYATGFPRQGSLEETARACMEAGFRAFREHLADPPAGKRFDSRKQVRRAAEQCRRMREGVGPDGEWAIDFHTRVDFADAVRLCQRIEDYEPLFVEDLVRSENPAVYRELRPQVKVPIGVGEHFGDRWEINELIENRLIDYSRVTLPNTGGITEMLKIAALCETHYIGLVPHFTGPIAVAALVHLLGTFPGQVMQEMTGRGEQDIDYLPQKYDFKNGKLWPNSRPGLGVEVDTKGLELLLEVTEHRQPIPLYRRPDGSITNW